MEPSPVFPQSTKGTFKPEDTLPKNLVWPRQKNRTAEINRILFQVA